MELDKHEADVKILGPNPNLKHIDRTLKSNNFQQMHQSCTVLPDLEHLNTYFVSVGQVLSSTLPNFENNAKIIKNKEEMFVYPTYKVEVSKLLKK